MPEAIRLEYIERELERLTLRVNLFERRLWILGLLVAGLCNVGDLITLLR
jgi:hypothetical protein